MPISIQDLQQIATRADLVQLRQEIAKMVAEVKDSLTNGSQSESASRYMVKPFYSPTEFGRFIGVSRQTIVRWAQEGIIKALQKGGKGAVWLIPHSEIERLIEESDDIQPQIGK